MTRLLLVVACLAIALLLTTNYSRTTANATRSLARHEGTHHLPRLGAARDAVVARLARTWQGTVLGTQVGLLLTAAVAWFAVPAGTGAESFAVPVCVWTAGQAGRALGAARVTRAGTAPRRLTDVVPAWLLATWVLGAAVLLWAGTEALGAPAVAGVGVAYLVGAVALGVLSAWVVRRALSATSFLDADVPDEWTESLRGEAVRAAVVLWPGYATSGALFVMGLLAVDQTRSVEQSVAALAVMGVAFLGWVATLLAGWRSVRWHATREGYARPAPRDA